MSSSNPSNSESPDRGLLDLGEPRLVAAAAAGSLSILDRTLERRFVACACGEESLAERPSESRT